MRAPKAIGHDDRISVVDHVDELRLRIIVSLAAFGLALGLCLWQSHLLLRVVDAPLGGRRPVTFGVAEPFTATLTVAAYAALVLTLPVLLHQAAAYILPALRPDERRAAVPMLVLSPALFVAGTCFTYFVVLPVALRFLLHFNADQFNVQIRATDWYGFFGVAMLAGGLIFQVPVAILAATRLGLTTPRQLRRNRRYAIAICAVVAAALPGVDPLSMIVEMLPLVALFEFSLVLATLFGQPRSRVAPAPEGDGAG